MTTGRPTGRFHSGTTGPEAPLNLAATDIDLSRVQAEFEQQLDELLRRWTDISADQRRQVIDQVRVAVHSDDLAALAALSVSTTEAAEVLTAAMGQMALDAAREVVREARDQGVRIDPIATDGAPLAAVATTTAALLAEGLTNAAGREALRRYSRTATGDEVAGAVREHLEGLSDQFLRDHLGGAMHAALNAGRMGTALAGPVAAIYGSEQMDKATCKPCEQINGKWIGNSDDPDIVAKVAAIYPNGGYVDCLGGARCRGTTVYIWRPEQVTDDGGAA